MYMAIKAVLPLYVSGRTTGIVFDNTNNKLIANYKDPETVLKDERGT